jgi:hypothetical protein
VTIGDRLEPASSDLSTRVAEAAALTLDLDRLLDRVHKLIVPDLVDLVGIHLPTSRGLARYLAPHTTAEPPHPRSRGLARRLLVEEAMPYDTTLPAIRAYTTGVTVLVDDVDALPQAPDVDRVRRRGGASGAAVPLAVNGEVLGTLGLARRAGRPQLAPSEIALAERVAARIAVAVGHAQRFDRERDIAETLQRALLPGRLRAIDGVDVTARYVPGAPTVQIGGDWYDTIALPGGRVGLVIGDVAGRGIRAAAIMGQLRAALRAYVPLDLPPARVLTLLDTLVRDLDDMPIVTAVYAVHDPAEGTLTYARAGHPPPLVRRPDGPVQVLDRLVGAPLGAGVAQRQSTVAVEPGSVVALYTDGLVEDRHQLIDVGIDQLTAALGDGPDSLDDLADHLLRRMRRDHGHDDDVAPLLAQCGGECRRAAHRAEADSHHR